MSSHIAISKSLERSEGPKISEGPKMKSLKISEGSKIPNDGSKKRKFVPMKKPHQFIPNGPKVMLPVRKLPKVSRKQLHLGYNLVTSRKVMLILAEIGLSSFNADSVSQQGPEYELVNVYDCLPLPRIQYYHCNFTARRKNEPEAEDMLFFAEVQYDGYPNTDRDDYGYFNLFSCHFCCILGPAASESGRFPGKSCCISGSPYIPDFEGCSGFVHHPEGGYTSISFERGTPKLTVV